MICFGGKTDQEVKKWDMWVPLKKKTKQKQKEREGDVMENGAGRSLLIFFYFFLLSLLSSIYGNRTVGIRRGKKKSVLLDEGYA